MKDQNLEEQEWLFEQGEIVEQPFSSGVPLFSPLIVWFRTMWNSVATKWYVRPMLDQQNDFNRQVVERIRDYEAYTYNVSSEQERDLGRLRHDMAALHLQLTQLNRRLAELNDLLEEEDAVAQENGERDGA
jgi:hypothetical protein